MTVPHAGPNAVADSGNQPSATSLTWLDPQAVDRCEGLQGLLLSDLRGKCCDEAFLWDEMFVASCVVFTCLIGNHDHYFVMGESLEERRDDWAPIDLLPYIEAGHVFFPRRSVSLNIYASGLRTKLKNRLPDVSVIADITHASSISEGLRTIARVIEMGRLHFKGGSLLRRALREAVASVDADGNLGLASSNSGQVLLPVRVLALALSAAREPWLSAAILRRDAAVSSAETAVAEPPTAPKQPTRGETAVAELLAALKEKEARAERDARLVEIMYAGRNVTDQFIHRISAGPEAQVTGHRCLECDDSAPIGTRVKHKPECKVGHFYRLLDELVRLDKASPAGKHSEEWRASYEAQLVAEGYSAAAAYSIAREAAVETVSVESNPNRKEAAQDTEEAGAGVGTHPRGLFGEPWALTRNLDLEQTSLYDNDGRLIMSWPTPDQEIPALALRIRNCVNACAGVSDEAMAVASSGGHFLVCYSDRDEFAGFADAWASRKFPANVAIRFEESVDLGSPLEASRRRGAREGGDL